jgi:hypothetical protein
MKGATDKFTSSCVGHTSGNGMNNDKNIYVRHAHVEATVLLEGASSV